MVHSTQSTALAAEFHRIVDERRLTTLFQPIVHLESGATVGYEALVRGPENSALASAQSLLAAAYQTARVVEFDWVARASACRAAEAAGLGIDQLLFLNIEPIALDSECPPDLWPDIKRAFDTFQVVLEVTERSLDRDPGLLLDGLERHRPRVAGLALDDVGADPVTLALLPIIAPAVIKLDRSVTQRGPDPAVTRILDAVYEEAERTGATILAEGIETTAQRDLARSFGAALGQGHYFGTPGALPSPAPGSTRAVAVRADTTPPVRTPFEALAGHQTGRASADLLRPLSHQLEAGSAELTPPGLLLVLMPDQDLFGPAERRLLAKCARRGVMTGLLGRGMPAEPGRGVRGGRDIPGGDDDEWSIVRLSPGSSGAMLARAVPGDRAEFEFGVTHDPRRVIAAARCLFRRLRPTRHQPQRHCEDGEDPVSQADENR